MPSPGLRSPLHGTEWIEQDTDFHVFITHLYSLVSHCMDPADPCSDPPEMPIPGIKNETDILIEWLLFLQNRIKKSAAIILDDYHLVQENAQINRAVNFIIQRFPEHICLIVIGRKELPLELSRLRAHDQLVEISERELAFTCDEIRLFFHRQPAITKSDIDEIYQVTHGWAASLVLLRYTLRNHDQKTVSVSQDHIGIRPDYIFTYLNENIFNLQPDHVRHFMMKVALLPEIDARLCERIFKVNDARMILNRMLEDHLLIFPMDDTGRFFYLHHLFRDFLLEQLHQSFSESEVCALHCCIGNALEPDDLSRALYHYIEGRDYDHAIKMIKTHEIKFILEGKIHFLGRQIKKIPEIQLKKHPQLLLSLSRLHSHYGDPETAIALISHALKRFKQRDEKEEMISCVIELGSQYYYSGHLMEARLLMEQVLDDIDPHAHVQTYIIAMTFLTFFCSVLGEFDASKAHEQNARQIIGDYPGFERGIASALLDTSLSHTLYFAGEFESSQQLCKILLKTVLRLNIEPCMPLVYYQLSANSYYLGEYDAGCTYARKGIEICKKMSLSDSRKGWVYLAWAQNSLGLGHFEDVLDKIEACTPLFEQPGNRWGLVSTWDCLAELYRCQGKTTLARQTLKKGLDMIKGHGLTLTQGILETNYAKTLLDDGRYRAGLVRLDAARQNLNGAAYHLFTNELLAARAQFNLACLPDAWERLVQAMALSKRYAYERFVDAEKNWITHLLRKMPNISNRLTPTLRRYFNALFNDELNRIPTVLKIRLLGTFTLGMGDREIPVSDWKSAKAMMILKYLAANRNRGYIHREKLIELLWPEQDPQKTAARFNMAMSALRRTLEPDISPKAPSGYIDRKKDTYRLFDDHRVEIDTETFTALFSERPTAEKVNKTILSRYLDAIALYRGAFLEEDPYEEWCIEPRETLSKDYTRMLQAVIGVFEQQNDWNRAIVYAEKLFLENPVDEKTAKKLMSFYSRTDAVSEINSTYERYARAARRFDLPVSEKVTAYRHNLVKI